MSLYTFFSHHPVFTVNELAAELGQRGSRHAGTRQAILAHHLRQGRIVRVRRGLYAVVPFGVEPSNHPVDSILVAAKLTDDAILDKLPPPQLGGSRILVHTCESVIKTAQAGSAIGFVPFLPVGQNSRTPASNPCFIS